VAVPEPGVTIRPVGDPAELLEWLKEEVPDVPWVVVVDGIPDAFAEAVCLRAKNAREGSRFWLVGSGKEVSEPSALAALSPLRLNPQDAADRRFLENLVTDLAIVPAEPRASQGERLRRWLTHARYILAEELADSVIEDLRTPGVAAASRATVCVLTRTR
jgi:hypothetical protein